MVEETVAVEGTVIVGNAEVVEETVLPEVSEAG